MTTSLAGVSIGPGAPVRIMGVINASPESFYKSSVRSTAASISRQAERMALEGADFIDVGAMSTAPYLKTRIPEAEEARRLASAVKAVRKACSLPVSIDTSRRIPAEAGLDAGAAILNDVTGLRLDASLGNLAKHARGVILMAHPIGLKQKNPRHPLRAVKSLLRGSLSIADRHGIPRSRIVLDPGLGFFRTGRVPWWKWDLQILHHLSQLRALGRPLLIGVSRKSFIGYLLGGLPPEKRLQGSLAATAIAVWNGAGLIRTHDVAVTRQTASISKSIRDLELL